MSTPVPTSYAFLCRACLGSGYVGMAERPKSCIECGSEALVLHDELFSLSLAHIDCDAFYCSVEKRDNPTLVDRPVIVGGEQRGVVAAACYIARRYGIRSAMPTWQAKRACPELVIIKPRMAVYQTIGRQIREMMLGLTPLVQPLSIDEAFLDLAGTQKLHHASPALSLARLQKHIKTELGLTVSIGLAANKSLAKIASDQDKPNGFYVIGAVEAKSWLEKRPASLLFGLGKSQMAKLKSAGVNTCGDIVNLPAGRQHSLFGSDALRLVNLASGIDERPVVPHSRAKSISSETTFSTNISELDMLLAKAEILSAKVSRQLKAKRRAAIRVTVKLKFPTHRLITRSRMLAAPSQMHHDIFAAATDLLRAETGNGKSYRLLGVGVELSEQDIAEADAAPTSLLDLVDEGRQKKNKLEVVIDQLHEKLGDDVVKTGRQLKKPPKK
ncbi:MAG: DNA polymerase IV [Alphaproteobacteria bacterium]|nr:DNA polymerase IV [Alphaproteobacteria bacterium]MBL6776476.1 DNA polymerase IV [Alphaproteobacteria bacterium]